eukprot:5647739-Amphidinium_carterae.2
MAVLRFAPIRVVMVDSLANFDVGSTRMWNCLDFVLVILSVQDMILADAGVAGSGFNVTFVRILRLLRVSKMFRVFRVLGTPASKLEELRICQGRSRLRCWLWNPAFSNLLPVCNQTGHATCLLS